WVRQEKRWVRKGTSVPRIKKGDEPAKRCRYPIRTRTHPGRTPVLLARPDEAEGRTLDDRRLAALADEADRDWTEEAGPGPCSEGHQVEGGAEEGMARDSLPVVRGPDQVQEASGPSGAGVRCGAGAWAGIGPVESVAQRLPLESPAPLTKLTRDASPGQG